MKQTLLIIVIMTFASFRPVIGQNTAIGLHSLYLGGVDSLEKHISKNIRNKIELSSDQLLFFKIDISKKKGMVVKELYGDSNTISLTVKKSIEAIATNWKKPAKGTYHIVLPIFLITEKSNKLSSPLTHANFKQDRDITPCILFPPIVFTYYLPSH